MEIIKVIPRGYCQGVVRAILIAKKTVKENPDIPVTMFAGPIPSRLSQHSGATGFDTIALREEASRGLLASLNRGTVKLN